MQISLLTIAFASLALAHPRAFPRDISSGNLPRQSTIWQPKVLDQMQMILSGIPDIDTANPVVSPDVPIFDIDLFNTPNTTIQALQKLGKKVVCYFSAGTSEEWRSDYNDFDKADIGTALPDWPGENYLNLKSQKVMDIMVKRLDMAKQKGCDGVDPDNMDAFTTEDGGGFNLQGSDTVAFLRNLSTEAHSRNMAIGLKNAADVIGDVSSFVEFAVNENCALQGADQGDTCSAYKNFTNPPSGAVAKPVFHVEYVNHTESNGVTTISSTMSGAQGLNSEDLRKKLCVQDTGLNQTLKLSTEIKVLDLDGWVMWCDGSVGQTKTKEVPNGGRGGS